MSVFMLDRSKLLRPTKSLMRFMPLKSVMSRICGSLGAVAVLLVASHASANERVIREELPKAFPRITKIDEVVPSPVAGLWAVRMGGQIVYTNADASILVDGQMVDTKTKANLTREALAKALAVDFNTLPLADALVTHKHGTGERRIAVFADPTCGFCKRYEPTLHQMQNVTVYTYVLAILGQQAQDVSKAVLCAPDPAKAWNAWMLEGRRPADVPGCDAPILERNRALAAKLGISSTPTTLLTDRNRLSGAVPEQELRGALDKAAAAGSVQPAKAPASSGSSPGASAPKAPQG